MLGATAIAGSPLPAGAADPTVDVTLAAESAYPDMQLIVTVTDPAAPTALSSENVTVLDNDVVRAATIQRVQGDQLEVMIVLDTSGSMVGEPIDAARRAAISFLDQVPPGTRVGVVSFGSAATLAVPLSSDTNAAKAGIGRLQASGDTALNDAVVVALDQFAAPSTARRRIVLLSDGGDTASVATLPQVGARLEASGVRLDTVALASGESDEASLQQLTRAGRGTLARANDAGGLAAVYDTLGRAVANQYRVAFRTESEGSALFRVEIAGPTARWTGELAVDLPVAAAPTTTTPATSTAPVVTTVGASPDEASTSSVPWWALAIGGAAWFAALTAAGLVIVSPSRRNLLAAARRGAPSLDRSSMSEAGQRMASVAERALEGRGLRERLNGALERAGLELRPGEFLVIVFGAVIGSLLLGTVLFGLLVGLVVGALPVALTAAVLSIKKTRRQRAITSQLSDALQMISNSLRTGYAVAQAMNVVAQEAPSPICDEFRRVLVESRLGRDLTESLRAMADRAGGDDVRWMVQAMEINREVGGDLAEVLDNVASTIRERDQLRRQVEAVSAEGKLSAYVLVSLPIGLAAMLATLNPSYFSELTHGFGLVLVSVGVVMLSIGSVVLNRLVKIDL